MIHQCWWPIRRQAHTVWVCYDVHGLWGMDLQLQCCSPKFVEIESKRRLWSHHTTQQERGVNDCANSNEISTMQSHTLFVCGDIYRGYEWLPSVGLGLGEHTYNSNTCSVADTSSHRNWNKIAKNSSHHREGAVHDVSRLYCALSCSASAGLSLPSCRYHHMPQIR